MVKLFKYEKTGAVYAGRSVDGNFGDRGMTVRPSKLSLS